MQINPIVSPLVRGCKLLSETGPGVPHRSVERKHLAESKGLETWRIDQKAAGVDTDKLELDRATSLCQTRYRTQEISPGKSRPLKPTVMPKGQSSLYSAKSLLQQVKVEQSYDSMGLPMVVTLITCKRQYHD